MSDGEHGVAADRAVRLAFVQSTWHEQHRRSVSGFVHRGDGPAPGVGCDQIDLFRVPGAFEIPLHAKRLAESGRYAAIVGAGFVIDGGIYRHDFVAEAVINGLIRVQLDSDVPVISAVLTPHHFHGHDEHEVFLRPSTSR